MVPYSVYHSTFWYLICKGYHVISLLKNIPLYNHIVGGGMNTVIYVHWSTIWNIMNIHIHGSTLWSKTIGIPWYFLILDLWDLSCNIITVLMYYQVFCVNTMIVPWYHVQQNPSKCIYVFVCDSIMVLQCFYIFRSTIDCMHDWIIVNYSRLM